MTFSAKVISDLLDVAQGYRDHINYTRTLIEASEIDPLEDSFCQTIIVVEDDPMEDGLSRTETVAAYQGYAEELNQILAILGIDQAKGEQLKARDETIEFLKQQITYLQSQLNKEQK